GTCAARDAAQEELRVAEGGPLYKDNPAVPAREHRACRGRKSQEGNEGESDRERPEHRGEPNRARRPKPALFLGRFKRRATRRRCPRSARNEPNQRSATAAERVIGAAERGRKRSVRVVRTLRAVR